MSKATHTGRLKSAKHIANKHDKRAISKEFALYLIENENEVRELNQFGNNDTRYMDGDMCVVSSYFTDLKPIKPVIEIPKCPFWIKDTEHNLCNIIELKHKKYIGRNLRYDCGFEISDINMGRRLNNNEWTICEEPKKKMRPFTDEEWEEWFLNDGVYMLQGRSLYRALGISSSKMIVLADMDDYDPNNVIGTPILDRHGNKFEKVAE